MPRLMLLLFVLIPAIAYSEESETKFCGCQTPWVVFSGPATGTSLNLAQIEDVDERELLEFADYNRLTCTFPERFYPGFCHGMVFGDYTVGAVVGRSRFQLTDDVVSAVIEAEFGTGRRLASVFIKASNVKCSMIPADGVLIQSYTLRVIEDGWSKKDKCGLADPLPLAKPLSR